MPRDLSTLLARVDAHRLRELLVVFANIASPPEHTASAAEWYAGCLRACGAVEVQLVRDWPDAPSVVAGFPGLRRRPTLEFTGHLDTLPLPPVRAYHEGGRVWGRGLISGKGGLIAAAEAARVLAEAGPLPGGGLLIVAHSRHLPPEGDGQDLARLIWRGMVGDAAVITSGDHDLAPVAGLGHGFFGVTFTGPGAPWQERHLPRRTMPPIRPTVIDAAQAFTTYLRRRRAALVRRADPIIGAESIVVDHIAGGDRLQRPPISCRVEGIWRWLPGRQGEAVRAELEALAQRAADLCGVEARVSLTRMRDGYRLPESAPVVAALREGYQTVMGQELPLGTSAFASDVPIFLQEAGVAAVCHGLDSSTLYADVESVAVDELVRATRVYIGLAFSYLSGAERGSALGAARPRSATPWPEALEIDLSPVPHQPLSPAAHAQREDSRGIFLPGMAPAGERA